MKKLMMDLETKSDVDITKAGVYRYADSPYFDILLFAYSVDDNPVQVVDLASGEQLPEEILNALTDDRIQKHAFNASFERVCLSVWLRRNYPERFGGCLRQLPQPERMAMHDGGGCLSGLAAEPCRRRSSSTVTATKNVRGQSPDSLFLRAV